jgi:hypothetical protein
LQVGIFLKRLRSRADVVGMRVGRPMARRMPWLILLLGLALGPVAFAQGAGQVPPTPRQQEGLLSVVDRLIEEKRSIVDQTAELQSLVVDFKGSIDDYKAELARSNFFVRAAEGSSARFGRVVEFVLAGQYRKVIIWFSLDNDRFIPEQCYVSGVKGPI